jgi:uncharacterized iron-regulated protein
MTVGPFTDSSEPTFMRALLPLRGAIMPAGLGILFLSGCATVDYFDSPAHVRGPVEAAEAPSAEAARSLPMFTGAGGTALGWKDLMDAVAWADVVIIGEQHDDEVGHAVQLAVVQDTVARWPRSVLSMEMLERDEQPLIEDYFDGIIDAEQFARLTFSESWAGDGSWQAWYQPMIDAARDGGGRVVAANAPRRYVKLARTHGYTRLDALPRDRRRWVNHPARLPEGLYRKRFWEVMTPPEPPEGMPEGMPKEMPEGMPEGMPKGMPAEMPPGQAPPGAETEPTEAAPMAEAGQDSPPDLAMPEPPAPPETMPAPDDEPAAEEATEPEEGEEAAAPEERRMPFHPLTDEEIEAIFRSQLVWDATMAESIARATRSGASKVVHVVGQFHCDFEGGTVQELRRHLPGARILVISMQRAWPAELLEDDRGRADIVIYTGERPPEEEEEQAEPEAEENAAEDQGEPGESAPPAEEDEEGADTGAAGS